MDITLTQVVEFLLKYCSGTDITIVLVFLMLADVFYACRWRVQTKKPLLSRRFNNGVITNICVSFIPMGVTIVGGIEKHGHSYFFDTVSIILGVLFCLSFLQSLIANMKLCGIGFPGWLQGVIDKYIEPEINAKENRARDEAEGEKVVQLIAKEVNVHGQSKK